MKNQRRWVIDQLNSKGYVSRNEALKNHITRLAAYITDLREEGWSISGHRRPNLFGNDYIYEKVGRSFKSAKDANEFIRSL